MKTNTTKNLSKPKKLNLNKTTIKTLPVKSDIKTGYSGTCWCKLVSAGC